MVCGRKVFVAVHKADNKVVGIKGVEHFVVRTPDGKYVDPTKEPGEEFILFIPIPTLFTPEQIQTGITFSYVALDLNNGYEYAAVVKRITDMERHCRSDVQRMLD